MSAAPSLLPPPAEVDLIQLENTRFGVRVGGLAMLCMGCAAPLLWSGATSDPRVELAAWILWVDSVVAFAIAITLLSPPLAPGRGARAAKWLMAAAIAWALAGPALRMAVVLDGSPAGPGVLRVARYSISMGIVFVGLFPRVIARLCARRLAGSSRVWNGVWALAIAALFVAQEWPPITWAYAGLGVIAFFLAQHTSRALWLEGIARHARAFAGADPAAEVQPLRPARALSDETTP